MYCFMDIEHTDHIIIFCSFSYNEFFYHSVCQRSIFLFQGLGFSQLTTMKTKPDKAKANTMGFGQQELRSAVEENKERDELLKHTEARYVIVLDHTCYSTFFKMLGSLKSFYRGDVI